MFHIFGNPCIIVSDRGTAFTAREFSSFVKERKIYHRLVAVAAPWANGVVERVNRFLKSSISKIIDNLHDWKSCLPSVQYTINNTYPLALKALPNKILLGYELRDQPDIELIRFLNKIASSSLDSETDRVNARKLELQTTDKVKQYNKMYYDKNHKKTISVQRRRLRIN